MGAQHFGTLGFCTELGHHPMPQGPRCPQFGGLHEEIHADGKEERQAACEFIHVHARFNRRTHIFTTIRKV